jgi:hypothetical protein
MRLNLSLGAVATANLLAALGFQWVILTTLGVGGTTDEKGPRRVPRPSEVKMWCGYLRTEAAAS